MPKRFAIQLTKINLELAKILNHGVDLWGDEGKYFTFTINKSDKIVNRQIKSAQQIEHEKSSDIKYYKITTR